MSFDDIDDDDVRASQVLGTGPLTVEAWVRPSANTATGLLVVGADDDTGWSLEINSGQLTFWVSTNVGWQFDRHSTALQANQWYHVAGTYVSGAVRTFVDGVASTGTSVGGLTQGPFLRFGGLTIYPFFGGVLDEVRISNVIRYTTGFTPPGAPFTPDANTLGLWSFDEGSGQTTADESVSGNTGTLGSTAGPDANDPVWVAGYPFP